MRRIADAVLYYACGVCLVEAIQHDMQVWARVFIYVPMAYLVCGVAMDQFRSMRLRIAAEIGERDEDRGSQLPIRGSDARIQK